MEKTLWSLRQDALLMAIIETDVQPDWLAVASATGGFSSCSKTAPLTECFEQAIENRVFSMAIH